MIVRVEVTSKIIDSRAEVLKNKIKGLGFRNRIRDVKIADVYTLEKTFTKKQLEKITQAVTNPVSQQSYTKFDSKSNNIEKFLPVEKGFTLAIEVGFLPGVTDNVGATTKEIIEDLLKLKFKRTEGVYSSQLIFILGNLSKMDAVNIAESLVNPLIQRIHVKSFDEFMTSHGMDLVVPKVKIDKKPAVLEVDLDVDDDELIMIGKQGIMDPNGIRRGPLALDLSYMRAIQRYFQKIGRKPTDVEIESIAQTWSEHCKHTVFSDRIDDIKEGLFKAYIRKATEKIRKQKSAKGRWSSGRDYCVSVFGDNSGGIEFDENYLVTHKVETHNTPSALDPFGGSITGIVGVNRDTIGFGLGAKPIANVYGFCLADPRDSELLYKGPHYTQKMLSPRRIMEGVIAGVNAGGNQSGIPTPHGFLYFDHRYKGKPLVFVGTIGLIPKSDNSRILYEKKAQVGDYIVMIGGRVGIDGVHGATFSSEALDSGSPVTAVQIGDPITQKKFSDAIVKEARDLNLYNSITDNGAGGLSCSVAEMAKESNGCKVYLDKVPLKYPNLSPWQTWISESQERMTLSVPKNKWKKCLNLMRRRGIEATVIGKFNDSGKCQVYYKSKIVMDIDLEFLHGGLPKRPMLTSFTKPAHIEPEIPQLSNLSEILEEMLQRLNLTSFEFVSTQYDHEVQSNSVIKPLQGRGRVNGDAVIIKPLITSNKGLVITSGLYPTYSDIDTYYMAAASIDTAIRNAVVAGANPNSLAILDNFCWASSNELEMLGQLKKAAQACYDFATAYKTPFISGKDSMFNDFKGFDEHGNRIKVSIPPTLLISAIGTIDDITKSVSIDLKLPGDLVYILGDTKEELGGSEYYAYWGDKFKKRYIGNTVPITTAAKNLKLYHKYFICVGKELISSAIGIGRGGLGVALAKKSISGLVGLDINLKELADNNKRDDFALFSESQGRIIVSIAPQNKEKFERLMKGCSHTLIGVVREDNKFTVKGKKGNMIINTDAMHLLKNYKKTFKNY